MPSAPCTILGGLPVIADVWFSRGDGYMTDDDAGVDALYWMKRDGSKGKELSQKLMDRIEKHDYWWQADVTEQVFDYLAHSVDDQPATMVSFDVLSNIPPPVGD